MAIKHFQKLITFLLVVISFSCQQQDQRRDDQPGQAFKWKENAAIDPAIARSLDTLNSNIENRQYGYLDEIFIAKGDRIIFQKQYDLNYDSISWGKSGKMGCGSNMCEDSTQINLYNYYHPKYHPYYLKSNQHSVQSITKSVVSAIVVNAILNGHIGSINDSIYPYFSHYDLSDSMQQHLKSTTLKDLLTMQMGLEWTEEGLTLESKSDVTQMELSDDWIAYVLSRKIVAAPGEQWVYSSGVSQLLSQIIQSATGRDIRDYAEEMLFKKLGIIDFYWKTTPSGLSDTEGGLYLKAGDLAKIGLLYQQKGRWDGEQLISEKFISESLDRQVKDIYQDGGKEGYGYQWWISVHEPPLSVALGYGNQIMVIMPEKEIVAIVYSWNVFDNGGSYVLGDLFKLLGKIAKTPNSSVSNEDGQ
ncbi:MAG: serine hydrolase [Bacteroidota bacterium]